MNQLCKRYVFLSAVLLLAGVVHVAAQYKDTGKLNVWTSAAVSRSKRYYDTGFKEIRVGKNTGFDRITVEFIGDLPNWEVKFVKLPIPMGESEENLKIEGKAFIEISLALVPYPDDSPDNYTLEFPKTRLKMPVINEIKNSEWFEGYLSFAVGLKKKTPFRVQELKNPSRLVVDFKQ